MVHQGDSRRRDAASKLAGFRHKDLCGPPVALQRSQHGRCPQAMKSGEALFWHQF
jgi:hypothetical protein